MSAVDRARAAVQDWTMLVVRGLPEHVARDRFDEIVSDLWEHQRDAERLGRTSISTAVSMLLRAARGAPADLAWRTAVGRRSERRIPTASWADRSKGTTMTKKQRPIVKPWVHLTGGEKPFDQTNGTVDFDVEDKHDAANPELALLEKGAATSVLGVGGLGLGG